MIKSNCKNKIVAMEDYGNDDELWVDLDGEKTNTIFYLIK